RAGAAAAVRGGDPGAPERHGPGPAPGRGDLTCGGPSAVGAPAVGHAGELGEVPHLLPGPGAAALAERSVPALQDRTGPDSGQPRRARSAGQLAALVPGARRPRPAHSRRGAVERTSAGLERSPGRAGPPALG